MISTTLQPVMCSHCHNANRMIEAGSETACFNCGKPLFANDPDITALLDEVTTPRTLTTAEQRALEPQPLTELERLRIRVVELETHLTRLPKDITEGCATWQHQEHRRGVIDAVTHIQWVLKVLGL